MLLYILNVCYSSLCLNSAWLIVCSLMLAGVILGRAKHKGGYVILSIIVGLENYAYNCATNVYSFPELGSFI